MTNSLVLLLAGSGKRTNLGFNKALYKINNLELFMYSLNTFLNLDFEEYILVCSKSDLEYVKEVIKNNDINKVIKYVIGGTTRTESVKNALNIVTTDFAFIHDAARPLVNKEDVLSLMASSNVKPIGTLYHKLTDTIKDVHSTYCSLDRENLIAVTTPQFFHKKYFLTILNNLKDITDETTLFTKIDDIALIEETSPNIKVTTKEDLKLINFYLNHNETNFIGHSLDYHSFTNKRSLILGGVKLDYLGLEGHSDADVVYHVVAEAIMGAAGLGDLGTLFPDTDIKYKDIDSSILIKEVMKKVLNLGYQVVNIDVMVYLIRPSLKDYKLQMADNIKKLTNALNVCVKAASLNKKGLISLEEGIGAEATCLLKK
jgi:2-C-methyl-D-erythritol 4-phosphate cytidylyltransferase/2-C-methyl-D-erythritol 2,4-cyclodiphosphate synthase